MSKRDRLKKSQKKMITGNEALVNRGIYKPDSKNAFMFNYDSENGIAACPICGCMAIIMKNASKEEFWNEFGSFHKECMK